MKTKSEVEDILGKFKQLTTVESWFVIQLSEINFIITIT